MYEVRKKATFCCGGFILNVMLIILSSIMLCKLLRFIDELKFRAMKQKYIRSNESAKVHFKELFGRGYDTDK